MAISDVNVVNDYGSGSSIVQQLTNLQQQISAAAAAAAAQNFIGSAAVENAPPLPPVAGPFPGNLLFTAAAYVKQVASSKLIVTATINCDSAPLLPPGQTASFQVLVNGTPLANGATLAPDAQGHMSLTLENERSSEPTGNVSIAVTVSPSALITVAALVSRVIVVVQEVRV